LGGAGCKDKTDTKTTETTTSAAPVTSTSAADAQLATWKTLAHADAHGNKDIDARIDALRIVTTQNPKKPDPWIKLGEAWVQKARASYDPGFYLNADACADIALSMDENDKLALGLKSLVALNQHRFADAKTISERVLKIDPDYPLAYGSLCDAAFELGDLELAAKSAQRMLDIKPNLPSYSRVAMLAWYYGKTAEAKKLAALAIDAGRDPKAPEPQAWQLVQTAMYFWHEGDYAGADAGCDQALVLVSSYPPALVCKARVALAKGDAKTAAQYLRDAHEHAPLVETAWLLSEAEEAAGNADAAAKARDAAEREGKKTDKLTLSRFWSTRNEHTDEALAAVEEELKTRGGVTAQDAHAWALYRAGKIPEAKAAMAEATKYGTPDARLYYHQGAIRMAAGEDKEGRALVEKALKQNPMFDVRAVKEARALLAKK
jgi:tetratricopeptide (TPR) repeat protein